MSENRRVLFEFSILLDGDTAGSLADATRKIRDALAAAGMVHHGVVAHKWQSWDSIVRDAANADKFDDDDDGGIEARAAKWIVEEFAKPGPKEGGA